MAQRKPDGVEDKNFQEEPDQGPAASRSATPAAAMFGAVKPGEAFPSGLKALDGKGDDEKVRICNLTLKSARFTRVAGPQASGKRAVLDVVMQPLETVEMTVAEARRVLTHQEAKAVRRPSPVMVVVGIFKGDCKGERKFTAHGREFRTCPFHDCPHADHADRAWSVWQSQHFLRTLKTREAIERYATDMDPRDAVTALANFERRAREKAHKEEQMQSATVADDARAVY